nr:immunoglobulin heavy chain junction region [Mus musculus]MBK4195065.1 immunoglobulin heavy chain junction region [Mus musculus]MBK4195066.1 immunoglobulin heavy chain junction region [Mus musculus]MBK4195067.1 immunoglobulin heavy chain junction region [Mus musculus]
CARERVYW